MNPSHIMCELNESTRGPNKNLLIFLKITKTTLKLEKEK